MPSLSDWTARLGDGPEITDSGEVIDIENMTLEQVLDDIEKVVDKEIDTHIRGKLRKDSGHSIRVDIDKRDLAWAQRIIEKSIDPRYPTRAHMFRDGFRLVLKKISEDSKSGFLDQVVRQDSIRRELEESAELAKEQHEFFDKLRANVYICLNDPDKMEYLQRKAEAYYVSGITEYEKTQLRMTFPLIGMP